MYEIRKKFKFEMAHILNSSYAEECQQVHGHSYCLEVFIKAYHLNDDGMVVDFKKLKEIVQKEIINKLDHKILYDYKNKNELTIQRLPGACAVDFNPTAENMVYDFYKILVYEINKLDIDNEVWLDKVRLHETDTGCAEYKE